MIKKYRILIARNYKFLNINFYNILLKLKKLSIFNFLEIYPNDSSKKIIIIKL